MGCVSGVGGVAGRRRQVGKPTGVRARRVDGEHGGIAFTWETAGEVAVLMPLTMLPMTPAMRPLLDPARRRAAGRGEVTTRGAGRCDQQDGTDRVARPPRRTNAEKQLQRLA